MKSHPEAKSFFAFRNARYRSYFSALLLTMMADNVEHVITYWMAFQKFHSAVLGGFAVVSHWVPWLVLAIPVGALAERFDPRRIMLLGLGIFMSVSVGWGCLFVADELQIWQAAVLLCLHGCAGVLWMTAAQIFLHDLVPSEVLASGIRLSSTARYLGMLAGPAVGAGLQSTLGPAYGIFVNAGLYLLPALWLWKTPRRPLKEDPVVPHRQAVRGTNDFLEGLGGIKRDKTLLSMFVLAGASSLLIGNSYQAQLPSLAVDIDADAASENYSLLLTADAFGALLAGLALEWRGAPKSTAPVAVLFGMLWAAALAGFAMSHALPVALVMLFMTGVFELLFASMAQTIVQTNAPAAARGRVIGAFNMSALGLRAFSGVSVGFLGAMIGVRTAVIANAALLVLVLGIVLWRLLVRPRKRA